MHAHGVPIAVPVFCRQNVSPKVNILLFITISSADMIKFVEISLGMSSLNSVNHLLTISML